MVLMVTEEVAATRLSRLPRQASERDDRRADQRNLARRRARRAFSGRTAAVRGFEADRRERLRDAGPTSAGLWLAEEHLRCSARSSKAIRTRWFTIVSPSSSAAPAAPARSAIRRSI